MSFLGGSGHLAFSLHYDFVLYHVRLAEAEAQDAVSARARSQSPTGSWSSNSSSSSHGLTGKVRAVSRSERVQQEWAMHFVQDHIPRAIDCYYCLAGEFAYAPHHRAPVPQAYTLGVDLVGPLIAGEHENEKGESKKTIRYGLVGVTPFLRF